jgi:two-component system, chemotaxis family, protein-glutamate methylesterase/glutaminase
MNLTSNSTDGSKRIRVLVVDDSRFMQRRIQEILEGVPDIRVAGFADNGAEAILQAEAIKPDVITMDVNMPKMDGLHAIDYIMRSTPRAIVVVSSYTRKGGPAALYALEMGVIDIMQKPSLGGVSLDLHSQAAELIAKVRTAARVKVVRTAMSLKSASQPARTHLPEAPFYPLPLASSPAAVGVPQVIAIGASTGGPVALRSLMHSIPTRQFPPILIVQHLPERFTNDLARQLDALSIVEVAEAEDGWPVVNGFAYVAPGGKHMEVDERHCIRLHDDPPVNYCRPSVDVLFNSVARHYGSGALACVLTGMGEDGAAGAAQLNKTGAKVIAQDEASSVVYGMPQAAVSAGGVHEVLSLSEIEARFQRIGERIQKLDGQPAATPRPRRELAQLAPSL